MNTCHIYVNIYIYICMKLLGFFFFFDSFTFSSETTQLSSKELVLEFYGFSLYRIHFYLIHNTYFIIKTAEETQP